MVSVLSPLTNNPPPLTTYKVTFTLSNGQRIKAPSLSCHTFAKLLLVNTADEWLHVMMDFVHTQSVAIMAFGLLGRDEPERAANEIVAWAKPLMAALSAGHTITSFQASFR